MKLLPGVQIVNRKLYPDNRGYFSETWKIQNDGMRGSYRQLNTAVSTKNVLRGMHRQNQTKLVMPVYGSIFDVALNPETGEWCGVELDDKTALLIPPEYAHGYLVLSDTAIVQYIVDKPYDTSLEEHFKWNKFSIDWPTSTDIILSEKDR